MNLAHGAAEPESTWYGAQLRFIAVGVQPYQYDAAFVKMHQDQQSGDIVLAPYRVNSITGVVNSSDEHVYPSDTEIGLTVFAHQRQPVVFAQAFAEFIKALFVRLPSACRKQARASAPTYWVVTKDSAVVADVRDPADMQKLMRAIFSKTVPVRKVPHSDVPTLHGNEAAAAAEPEPEDDESISDVQYHLNSTSFSRRIALSGVQFQLTVEAPSNLYFYDRPDREVGQPSLAFNLTHNGIVVWSMIVTQRKTYVRARPDARVDTQAHGPTRGRSLKAWIANALTMVQDLAASVVDDSSRSLTGTKRVFYRNFRTGPGRDDYIGMFRVASGSDTFKFEILDDRHSAVLGTVLFPRKQALELTLSTGKLSEPWAEHAFKIWKDQHHAS